MYKPIQLTMQCIMEISMYNTIIPQQLRSILKSQPIDNHGSGYLGMAKGFQCIHNHQTAFSNMEFSPVQVTDN